MIGTRLPWLVKIKQVITIDRVCMRSKPAQVSARMIHATGLDPSGLGMMQHEGRPQESKLKM